MSELIPVEKDGKKYKVHEAELEAWLNDGAKEVLKPTTKTKKVKKDG